MRISTKRLILPFLEAIEAFDCQEYDLRQQKEWKLQTITKF